MNNDRVYYSRDAEIHAIRKTTALALFFLALGLGIGTAMALLFAPSSGKKVRHNLAQSVEAGLKDGRDAVEPVVQRLEEEFAELRKKVEERLQ
jgi:gas vesicle protein